jgi:hypothetical protein
MGRQEESPYPGIALRRVSIWERLFRRRPRTCAHAGRIHLDPDQVPLRNGAFFAVRQPSRPSVEVCPTCFLAVFEAHLKDFDGRIVAFEPPREGLARYIFIEQDQMGDAELAAEDLIHCQSLLAEPLGGCQKCGNPALVLLVKRSATTESSKFASFRGGKEYYCHVHGSERLREWLGERLGGKPVELINLPYGERGAYLPTD